ncbi:hypothetical protein I6F35_22475 [Bradyrhizobium sp. BRP22]|uniref:hypothetical protein n=1 Tax=Bradyrhizobium sp. BRP22 TaxID=2793821 RepID=UPI001CD1A5CF|nr:hypothetical protein [Bradyrhizobium sp. BRP22]MCA1455936.1 hypothetical protein [Bradyrhizobium sp. BRP22]
MTVIKSKVERSYWKNVALSVIPDLLIAWAAMRLMDGGAEVFFGTLIALQAVYLALWIKRSAWSWLLFWLTNRASMSGHIEDVLARDNFPKPPDFISGPDDYYSEIVENKREACEMRIKAARELGTLAGISVAGQHQLAIQLRMAMEDGLQRYAKRPPAVSKGENQATDEVTLSLPKEELDTLAWLADYGFRLLTAPSETYRRSIDQLSYRQAAAFASLIDKFERKSVPDLLLEDEDEKERRFASQENRYHTLWSCYPNER